MASSSDQLPFPYPVTGSGPRDLPGAPTGWHKPTWDEVEESVGNEVRVLGISDMQHQWVPARLSGFELYQPSKQRPKGKRPPRVERCYVELSPGSTMEITNLAALALKGEKQEKRELRHG